MDKFYIDSHKLIFHPQMLSSWLKGELIYPIYIEVGLTGLCNQKSIFCAFDYYRCDNSDEIDVNVLKSLIANFSKAGVKSILYSGEGEPLLYRDLPEIISFTKKSGIDCALSSNGFFLIPDISSRILEHLSWLRISINAASDKSYSYIHNAARGSFNTVLKNIKTAVYLRDKNNYKATIGVQFILIRQNVKEVFKAAKIAKDLGVDYFSVKPYSPHPCSKTTVKFDLQNKALNSLAGKVSRLSVAGFDVIFRLKSFHKLNSQKIYLQCLGLDFSAHISSDGEVYPCNVFVGNRDYSYGNIKRDEFNRIWSGENRSRILTKIHNDWDVKLCRKSCRLDEINNYLWQLKNPNPHVNFI